MHSALSPNSPHARLIADLWWWMVGVGGAIWILVSVAAVYAAFARHGRPGADGVMDVAKETHQRIERVVQAAVGVTILILLGFLVASFSVGHALAQHPTDRALTIQVSGRQWWWQFDYQHPDPSKRVTTANEVHIPIGRPVQFVLEGRDVIHSLWAPSLDGKRDLIPGYETSLWIQADTPGVYRGFCAEFCGHQHAKMRFLVIADSAAAFDRWYAAQQVPAPEPTDSMTVTGRRVFLAGPCSSCHSIAGTPANGKTGPDLSHLASRLTIGAGILPNTRGNLAGWIVDPQGIKPGSKMPSNQLSPRDLQALLAYLVTLK
jgi:cytochrome c oxidase subunit 2